MPGKTDTCRLQCSKVVTAVEMMRGINAIFGFGKPAQGGLSEGQVTSNFEANRTKRNSNERQGAPIHMLNGVKKS